MTPRFSSRRKGSSRRDFPPEGMPVEVRGEENRWTVYNQYKIETEPYGKEYISILPAGGISRVYNPFTDSPEVFLAFATLGKHERPQKDKILEFVQTYGDILYNCPPGESYIGSSIDTFHREARVAYNALRLYEEIMGLEKEKVKQRMNCFLIGRHEINIVKEGAGPFEDCKDCENPEGCLDCEDAPPSKIIERVKDPIEAGSLLLTDIINCQIHSLRDYPVAPYVLYRFEYKQGKSRPRFYASWPVPTLLQAMWLIFFLKITDQLEQTFRICPVCEEPIISPRKNQIYHEGCRQTYYYRLKQEVLGLWKEGYSVEQISCLLGIGEERVSNLLNKKDGLTNSPGKKGV